MVEPSQREWIRDPNFLINVEGSFVTSQTSNSDREWIVFGLEADESTKFQKTFFWSPREHLCPRRPLDERMGLRTVYSADDKISQTSRDWDGIVIGRQLNIVSKNKPSRNKLYVKLNKRIYKYKKRTNEVPTIESTFTVVDRG